MAQLLSDETNGEYFKRIELLGFIAWMHKHSESVPRNPEEANELITRWLEKEREDTRAHILRKRKRDGNTVQSKRHTERA